VDSLPGYAVGFSQRCLQMKSSRFEPSRETLQLHDRLKLESRRFGLLKERTMRSVRQLRGLLGWARRKMRTGESRLRAPAQPVARRLEPVRWGNMRRLAPFSRIFGIDRGQCIDRWYIESFLKTHCADVKGRVLEIADREYTTKFGGDRVLQSDVLHAVPGNPHATLIGNLQTGAGVPESAFDCMLVTQTLPFVFDLNGAIETIYKALQPGGVALLTFPGISQISRYDMDRWGYYWRFTDASARRLFAGLFGPENVTVVTFGNVLAACAFLQGLASHELDENELSYCDKDYQVTIGVRVMRRRENLGRPGEEHAGDDRPERAAGE
jgi:hypothetical protein